jgi:ABC-type nitrate/sulfonate/bicarbonate transport system permease component
MTEQPAAATVAASPQTAQLNAEIRRETRRATLRALGRSVLTFVLTIVAVLVIWVGSLWVFQISPYVGKGPIDVYNFLFTVPNAAENRDQLFGQLWVTLGHSVVGFAAGLVVALLVAMIFQLSKGI